MTDRHVRLESGYVVRRPQAEPDTASRLMLALAVIAEIIGGVLVLGAWLFILGWLLPVVLG